MKQLLWFCRTSDSSSLSRITDSMIPLLKNDYAITLLSNPTNLTGINHVLMGADTKSVKYVDFIKSMPIGGDMRSNNLKYTIVQIVDIIYEGNFDYLLVCNGVYEIDWITKILTSQSKYLTNKDGKKTKLVVWAPIDYIPTAPVLENVIKADIFLTMTPVMLEKIKEIMNPPNKIDWLGHGSDISNMNKLSRGDVVERLNKMRDKKSIVSKYPFTIDDIIILNANNYGPLDPKCESIENTQGTRKRLDITVKAFLKVLEYYKSFNNNTHKVPKLWIHTNLRSFFEMLAISGILLPTFIDNIILSNNTVSNDELALICQMSNISIQTSYAEGWSLLNLESSMYRSLQVVPDFLACGWHYKDSRGLLLPVQEKTIKNEGGHNVIIGEVSVEDTSAKLIEALKLLENKESLEIMLDKAYEYSKSYTWKSITDKLKNIIPS